MVRLVHHRSLTSLVPDSSNLRRAFSEANIHPSATNNDQSFIAANQNHFTIGEKIVVSWNIKENTSDKDWIGLFYEDEVLPENSIDTRKRGIGKNKQGSIIWSIPKDLEFRSAINYCLLKYFYGPTGALLATSQLFSIDVPFSLLPKRMPSSGNIGADSLLVVSVSGLSAKDLKKGFFGKPNPYVRMCIVPRFRGLAVMQKYHGQQAKTIAQHNTVNPSWKNEVFVFHATAADFLEVEVRNKSGKGFSKFLGKMSFPLCTIMDSCGYNKFRTVTQSLVGRNPSEKVQGSFQFTIFIRKSAVAKEEAEGDAESEPSPRHQKPLMVSSSVPLDDMALPSGQPIAAGGSRRPLSYHPPNTYQLHCSTEPRNRNYTTNYFASAAFRGQGHPSHESEISPRRNRTSNSLCHERLSALSSEDESESQDDEETDSYEQDTNQTVADNSIRDTMTSQQNGHTADEIEGNGPPSSTGDVQAEDAAQNHEHSNKDEAVVRTETTVISESNSERTEGRAVTSLLRFTDPGPTFQEFVEQQNQSSSVEHSESSTDIEVEQESITNNPDVAPDEPDEAENIQNSSNVDEAQPDLPSEGNANIESTNDAAVPSEGEDADVSVDEESSNSSTSADDGGDSAEHGYVEFEPGYADEQSDTASQCSDVEDDEIYVGDDIPGESAEGTVLADGDLLTECLDMLSAVGYTDLRGPEGARTDDLTDVLSSDKPKGDSETDSKGKVNILDKERPLGILSVDQDYSAHIKNIPQKEEAINEQIISVESVPESNNNERNIGNVISTFSDIEQHAESLLTRPEEAKDVALGSGPHELVLPDASEGVVMRADGISQDLEGNLPSATVPAINVYTPRKDLAKQGDDDKKYRNRSYYKAVFDVSPDKESESQKLSKLNSALNAMWSPISHEKRGDSEESSQESNAKSQRDVLFQLGEQDDHSSEMTSSPIVSVPVASKKTDSSSVTNASSSTDFMVSNVSEPLMSSESSSFSSRHRILRKNQSDIAAAAFTSKVSSSSSRHQVSDRTDIAQSADTSYNASKLRYSISDPLSKSKNGVKIPLNKKNSADVFGSSTSGNGKRIDFNSPIFRTDLVESSVDDDVGVSKREKELIVKTRPIVPASTNVVFDATKLKDVSVKSMRETAILSSSEDISSGSSKNMPIGRSDQPIVAREITLPAASAKTDSALPNASENERRNWPIERKQPAASVASLSEDITPKRREEVKATPSLPSLPPRNSSFEHALQIDMRHREPPVHGPMIVGALKDPWQNVTVRKEKRSKIGNLSSDATNVHDSNAVNITKPLHAGRHEPIRENVSVASSIPPSVVVQSTSGFQPISSANQLDNSSNFLQNVSRDPTGATRPRTADRAPAIKKTFQDYEHDKDLPTDRPNRKRSDETEVRPDVRSAEVEHRSRVSSPSEHSQPLVPNKTRSPSEPPVPPLKDSSKPPSIPPRANRSTPKPYARSTHNKGQTPVPETTTSSPSVSLQLSASSSAASTPTVPHSAEVRKRPTNDPSKNRRGNNGAISRTARDGEPTHSATRSPAILHSDSQGRKGDGTNGARSGNHSSGTDSEGESLPSHWERAVDSHGRLYYIDHLHRTTTWKRPRKDTQATSEGEITTTAQLQQQHLQQYDRRYQSLRRTIRGQRRAGESNRPTILPQEDKETEPERNRDRPRQLSRKAAPARRKPEPSQDVSHTDGPTQKTHAASPAARPAASVSFEDTPGCRFIRRRDFFQYLNNHGMASQFLNRSTSLKQILDRIRSDPSKFERYQHSRDLVTLLNFFSNPAGELPSGWEKKADQFGHTYFIDHTTRSTTFIDPRLPLDESSAVGPRSRVNAPAAAGTPETVSSSRSRNTGTSQQVTPSSIHPSRGQGATPVTTRQPEVITPKKVSYNERVVAFLRQPGLEDIFKNKDCNLSAKNALRRKIMLIQRDGIRALDRLSNDIELVMLLSIFEDEIESFVLPSMQKEVEVPMIPETKDTKMQAYRDSPKEHQRPQAPRKHAPHRRDFEAKLRSFHRQLVQSGYGQGPGKIRMKIRRDHVVSDAFEQLMKQSPRALQKDRLYIKFLGEEGLDYGGPAREFFFLISRQCFDPYYGLFEYSASDTYTLQVSPVAARFVSNSHAWLRFCGRIIALSLVHQHLLDVFFTRTIYKALLKQSYDLSDLESFDPEFHQSLSWILENDITDVLDMFFTTDEKVFDQVTERPLKPGGESIPVTEKNKREYVELMIKWRMERGVGEQMKQLVDGFNEVLDVSQINIFDARELELVIAGTADIDVKDWRNNTDYRSGYHDKHPVIQWFWKAVDSVNNEQRLRLLQFVTGTSSIPFEGFAALRGSTGPRKFTVDCWGDPTMLPRAHTCFNRLDLPPYRNFEELYEKLLYAVEETSSFGIE